MVILTLSVLGEEVGWRGFALPQLQKQLTPLQSSLLMVFLFHWSLNMITVGYLPITAVIPAYLLLISSAWIIALCCVWLFRTKIKRVGLLYGHPKRP